MATKKSPAPKTKVSSKEIDDIFADEAPPQIGDTDLLGGTAPAKAKTKASKTAKAVTQEEILFDSSAPKGKADKKPAKKSDKASAHPGFATWIKSDISANEGPIDIAKLAAKMGKKFPDRTPAQCVSLVRNIANWMVKNGKTKRKIA